MLRDYQSQIIDDIYAEWGRGHRNVCAVLPTGAGKTYVMATIAKIWDDGEVFIIAHRQELVSQISTALNYQEIFHSVVAADATIRLCIDQHYRHHTKSYYHSQGHVTVCGVDTLVRRDINTKNVSLWMIDEVHHLLKSNKWGKAVGMMPTDCYGLGVTATPIRRDGQGLSRESDGFLDSLVVGPNMRDLITRGYLSDYDIAVPVESINRKEIKVNSNGNYSTKSLLEITDKSSIVGDVVDSYRKLAYGRKGLTFGVNIAKCQEIAKAYNDSGVPAEALSGKDSDRKRVDTIDAFKRGELMQLVNCDLFGEGFDLPAIEVVSMARPTRSYGQYCQSFGRALRIMEGKDKALIIDHVGNILAHGLPDYGRAWSLARREKRHSESDVTTITVCPNCTMAYERRKSKCPYCGHYPIPQARSSPEEVEGDLSLLDPMMLEAMRDQAGQSRMSPEKYKVLLEYRNCPAIGIPRNVRLHKERIKVIGYLDRVLALYCETMSNERFDDGATMTMFYRTFGIDMLSCQSGKKNEIIDLCHRILYEIGRIESSGFNQAARITDERVQSLAE